MNPMTEHAESLPRPLRGRGEWKWEVLISGNRAMAFQTLREAKEWIRDHPARTEVDCGCSDEDGNHVSSCEDCEAEDEEALEEERRILLEENGPNDLNNTDGPWAGGFAENH